MPTETLLLTAGPTNLPPAVREAGAWPPLHHRTAAFTALLQRLQAKAQRVFCTGSPILTLTGTGTAGMESVICNLFSPGDRVLVVNVGAFGDRFQRIALAFGLDVMSYQVPWGEAMRLEVVRQYLARDEEGHRIKGLFVTHNETSTGVVNDVEGLAALTKATPVLLVVDAVSSVAGIPYRPDEWGVDVTLSASQKSLMTPPGLFFVSLSEKARRAMERARLPRYFFDYRQYLHALSRFDVPFTPAVSLLQQFEVALDTILAEGLEHVYARHSAYAHAVRAGTQALGLELLVRREEDRSALVTTIIGPKGIDVEALRGRMYRECEVLVTGGQGALRGQVLRVGHMGYLRAEDIVRFFEALEYALDREGYEFELGAGIEAARSILDSWEG